MARKPTSAAGLTVVTVNGKAYVAGLVWRPLKSARNYKGEAKTLGKADGMSLVAIRHGRAVTQAGFAPRERTNHKGKHSLAASLAGVLGDDWIGVFDLGDDRYALIAVRRGAVLPGRDMVGDQDAIGTLLRETYNLVSAESDGVDTRILAPPVFEFGNESAALDQLLPPGAARAEHRLRPIALGLTPREAAITTAVVVLVGAGVYGYTLWHAKQLRIQAQNATLAEQQAAAAAAPPSEIVRPWVSVPAAHATLDACARYWRAVPLAIAGWRFTSGTCGPNGASRTYRNAGSTVEAFDRAVTVAPAYADAYNTATLSEPITLTPDAGDVLPALATREKAVTAYFQRIDAFTSASVALKPPPPPIDGEPATVPPWTTYTLTLISPLPPELVLAQLDMAGLRVLDIAVALDDSATLTWTTTGEFYAQ